MARDRKNRSSRRKKAKTKAQQIDAPKLEENRASVAATVFWMLTMMATMIALPLAVAADIMVESTLTVEETPFRLAILPRLMFLIATVTGTLTLIMIPVVYRIRETPPPPLITATAGFVGSLPWCVLIIMR